MSNKELHIRNNLSRELSSYLDFEKDPENFDKFLSILDDISLSKESSNLPLLLNLLVKDLDEFCINSLIVSIESFPPEQYIKEFLKYLDNNMQAGNWGIKGLFYGILNSNEHLEIFKKNMYLASSEALLKLFDEVCSESSEHIKCIVDLRKALKK